MVCGMAVTVAVSGVLSDTTEPSGSVLVTVFEFVLTVTFGVPDESTVTSAVVVTLVLTTV